MTRPLPPAWLEAFQARFSAMLRTPLDRSARTLRDAREGYSAQACADVSGTPPSSQRARLAVYNRQYWFRLLDVLQRELPLSHRLLGSWTFNEHALSHLERRPPDQRDLGCTADGLAAFIEAAASDRTAPSRALGQAARIDEAFRAVLRAVEPVPFVPTPAALARLESARLLPSPAVRFIEEAWPLLELRAAEYQGGPALPLPDALPSPRHWALCATADGPRAVALEPLQARFFELLREHSVGEALATMERANGSTAELAAQVERWLAGGMRLNLWSGIAG